VSLQDRSRAKICHSATKKSATTQQHAEINGDTGHQEATNVVLEKDGVKKQAKGPLEGLKTEELLPRSGASTPGFVRTAAEVADSAALLDKEEPEPELPDEEAGRLGLRRLSSTPIPDVAKIAAEVADTAQYLDTEDGDDVSIASELV